MRQALDGMDLAIEAVRSCAVGFPGPSTSPTGASPALRTWPVGTRPPVATPLSKWVTGPIVVDNDVNVMAWGEYDAKWRQEGIHDLLFIKHGTGIGCGIIANGQIYRGYDGTAGEVGHICVTDAEQDLMCSCGSKNCLEVVASGGPWSKG